MGQQIAERAPSLRAPCLIEPRREGIRCNQVPVAPGPRLGDGVVGRLARVEAHRQEERPVSEAPLRAGHGPPKRRRQTGGDVLGPFGIAWMPGLPPGRGDRAQALPGECLRVEAQDGRLDVRGELLGLEHPTRLLPARERAHVAGQYRSHAGQEAMVGARAGRRQRRRAASPPSSSSGRGFPGG